MGKIKENRLGALLVDKIIDEAQTPYSVTVEFQND